MNSNTWEALDAHFAEFPGSRAVGVPDLEIQEASQALGVPFPEGYIDFLRRYGGGHVGSYAVAGLRRWDFAANDNWSIINQTAHFRAQEWPGTARWAIFSGDGFGNPIGFDETGCVWLSDHDYGEIVGLELTFEGWIRSHALHMEEPSKEYFTQQKWPGQL